VKIKILSAIYILFFTIGNLQAASLIGVVEGGKKLKKSRAVVYLTGNFNIAVKSQKQPILDQHNMAFKPHVLPVSMGTTVAFLNSDEVRHNVYSPDQEKYNLGSWPKGEKKVYQFKQKGVYTQLCNVHPEMESFIIVLDTPYFVLAEKKGHFEIKNIPPGDYTVRVWHEKLRFKKQKITIGENDFEIVLNRK
jgi:plastocyanin